MSDVWDALAIRRCYLKRAGFWFASGKWMICDWLLPTHEITYCSLLLSGWRGYDWTGHTFSRPERWVGPVGPVGLLLFLAELCSEKKLGLPGLDIFFRRQALKEECDDRVKNYQEALIDQRATQLCIAFGWSIDLVDSGVEQYHTPHPVVLSRLTVSKPIHNFNFFGIEPWEAHVGSRWIAVTQYLYHWLNISLEVWHTITLRL